MDRDDVFEIFSILSKAVIVAPVIVVIIALVYKFNTKGKALNQIQPTVSPTTIQQQKTSSQSKINIDLKGPLVCSGKVEDLIINVFIKDKKIKIITDQKNTKDNIFFNGDCYYRWGEGEYVGERICGLSPFMSAAETMINLGVLNFNSITSQLTKLGLNQKIATNEAKITELVQNCKKKNINMSVFEVPGNILFKNKK